MTRGMKLTILVVLGLSCRASTESVICHRTTFNPPRALNIYKPTNDLTVTVCHFRFTKNETAIECPNGKEPIKSNSTSTRYCQHAYNNLSTRKTNRLESISDINGSATVLRSYKKNGKGLCTTVTANLTNINTKVDFLGDTINVNEILTTFSKGYLSMNDDEVFVWKSDCNQLSVDRTVNWTKTIAVGGSSYIVLEYQNETIAVKVTVNEICFVGVWPSDSIILPNSLTADVPSGDPFLATYGTYIGQQKAVYMEILSKCRFNRNAVEDLKTSIELNSAKLNALWDLVIFIFCCVLLKAAVAIYRVFTNKSKFIKCNGNDINYVDF